MILRNETPEFWYHKTTVKLCEQPRQSVWQMSYIIKQNVRYAVVEETFIPILTGCVLNMQVQTL